MRTWQPYSDGWDHDHCAFCQRHISVPLAVDDAINRSYVTEDNHHWICESCFGDFRELFAWTVGV